MSPHQDSFTVHEHSAPPQQMQWDAYTETSCDGVYPSGPSIQGSRISSRISLPSPTQPPTVHTHRRQDSEKAMSNFPASIRGPMIPSIISDNCTPSLGACEIPLSHSPPKNIPTSLEGEVIYSGGTLDRGSKLSGDISIITLPSFVEHEHRDSISTLVPTPQNPTPIVEGIRSLSTSRRSSPSQSPRPRDRNTTALTTPSSEKQLMDIFPSPSLSVSDRQQLHLPHRAHFSPSRRAEVKSELATARLRPIVRTEGLKIIQLGTPKPSVRPEMDHLGPDAILPPRITAHILSFPADYYSTSTDDRPRSLSMDGVIEPSPSCRSPIFGFFHSPSSHSSLDEGRSWVTSQARSSISTAPSPSAFPSPPNFPPGPRDKALSIISGYSISGRTFPSVKLWEGNSVRGIETISLNESQTSTPLPDADASRPTSAVSSRSVLSRYLHPESTGRSGMSVRSSVSSRISSMRRLSRMPSGPRQMSDRSISSQGTPQSSSF